MLYTCTIATENAYAFWVSGTLVDPMCSMILARDYNCACLWFSSSSFLVNNFSFTIDHIL